MAQGRDWRKTLFPASFRGVPFETERDEEQGGRRIVGHEFPMRDTPFLEDLGEAKREYDITAYVAADDAETRAAALLAVFAQRGAGILVLPTHGPLTVRCVNFKRDREKDRAGKIAIAAKFWREGASGALFTISNLANMVFAGADAAVVATAAYAARAIVALSQPDFVVEAAVSGIQNAAAVLETVRTSETVDPAVSGAQRLAISSLFASADQIVDRFAGVDGAAVSKVVTIARALSDGMPPVSAIRAYREIVASPIGSPPGLSLTRQAEAAASNSFALDVITRMAALTAYAEAIAQADIPDRQTAITLRADASEFFDAFLGVLSADDIDLYNAGADLAGRVTDYLSRTILDRAPVVQVEANRTLPALWWAHRLYNDAGRTDDLVARNRVAHPLLMPTQFEALAQ